MLAGMPVQRRSQGGLVGSAKAKPSWNYLGLRKERPFSSASSSAETPDAQFPTRKT